MNDSPASSLATSLTSESEALTAVKRLSETEAARLEYEWRFWARPDQVAPTDFYIWLILTGRGWGKTRTGAEWVRAVAESKEAERIALVTDTAADARDVMVEGESGIMACSPSWYRPQYEPSKRRLTWPDGQMATLYSAEDPEQLRGPQHDKAWADEIAKWQYGTETWDNLVMGLRLGKQPQCVVTTTPKPVKVVRDLVKRDDVVITRGRTYDNLPNLSPNFQREVLALYEGTRLGRQELEGELLDDVPGALWTRKMIDDLRVKEHPDLIRIVVAIDPAMTSGEDADETGIVVAGKSQDGHAYILADQSGHYTPNGWAERAVNLYEAYNADRVIGEANNGGEMVEHTIRSVKGSVPYRKVTATRGKRVRAEPVAALYEQGKVHHVGAFPQLEDQMCNFTPDGYDGSPDRLDAMVWAMTELDPHRAGVPLR